MLATGTPLHHRLVHYRIRLALTATLDPLSAWFLIVLACLAVPIACYSIGYTAQLSDRRSAAVGAGYNLLLGAVELVFVAADGVTFLLAWELMTLFTAALVATDHDVASTRRAAYLYLAMSHVGTGCLFAAFLILGSHSGSLAFSALLAGHVSPGPLRTGLSRCSSSAWRQSRHRPAHVWLPRRSRRRAAFGADVGVLIKTRHILCSRVLIGPLTCPGASSW